MESVIAIYPWCGMPKTSNVEAFFDGGCPNNPGPIGSWGYLICSPWIEKNGVIRGDRVTNNIAEYTALQKLMEELGRLDISSATIKGDAQMVVKIVNREWGFNQGMWTPHRKDGKLRSLAVQCNKLVSEGDHNLEWIPREENVLADQLATEALTCPSP